MIQMNVIELLALMAGPALAALAAAGWAPV